jgi:hypothetical protein
MLRLEDLIGKKITLALINSEKGVYTIKLHGSEIGGIWVESQDMENRLSRMPDYLASPSTQPAQKPVFFIPYAQIAFLIASSVKLDETSFEG